MNKEYSWNKDKRKRKGLCRQCGNTSDFICSKCHLNPAKKGVKEHVNCKRS